MGMFDWLGYGISHGYIPSGGCNDCPHYATDIGTPYHTPITALFSGTVVSQRTGLGWGTEIFIKPDNPAIPEYYYYHLDTLNTRTGQHLNAGDVIGLSGGQNSGGSNPSSTTFSTGPHTHVGFWSSWIAVPGLGTRPFGPNITPYILAFARGASTANIATDTSSSTSPAGASGSSDWQTQFHTEGIKIGLFLIAFIVAGFGGYVLFQKQADALLHKGLDAAKVAAI